MLNIVQYFDNHTLEWHDRRMDTNFLDDFAFYIQFFSMIGTEISGCYYLPNPSARAGYDTKSIFKRSLTGLNSDFSFS